MSLKGERRKQRRRVSRKQIEAGIKTLLQRARYTREMIEKYPEKILDNTELKAKLAAAYDQISKNVKWVRRMLLKQTKERAERIRKTKIRIIKGENHESKISADRAAFI